jgi:hypothetical protein
MKRGCILAVLAVAAAAAVWAAPKTFTVVNNTGYELKELYLIPTGNDDWGDNLLSDSIVDGSKISLQIPGAMLNESEFNIHAVDTEGDEYTKSAITFSGNGVVTLTFDDYVEPENSRDGEGGGTVGEYDSGYQAGWDEGHSTGLEEGKKDGYQEGFKAGYSQGYQDGFGKKKN